MKGWIRILVLFSPLLLVPLWGCSSSNDDKLDQLQSELDQVRNLLNGSIASIEKNSGKGEKLLGKYFLSCADGSDDCAEAGLFDKSKLPEGLDEKVKRDVAYLYLSTLLGKLRLSFLAMIADLMSVTTDDSSKGEGTFGAFSKFIPPALRSKEGVEANIDTLNRIDDVVDKNFGTQMCLQLTSNKVADCCAREAGDATCIDRANAYVAALPEKFYDDGSEKVRAATNKGLKNVATVSCFTSMIRSTALSVSMVGSTLEDLQGGASGTAGLVNMASSLKDGLAFSQAIEKLQGAALFIKDLTNMTTKSCVDSGLIPADNPFIQNLKKIQKQLDDKIALLKATFGEKEATEKAVTALITQQFGIRCDENGKNCCHFSDQACFTAYKDPLASLGSNLPPGGLDPDKLPGDASLDLSNLPNLPGGLDQLGN